MYKYWHCKMSLGSCVKISSHLATRAQRWSDSKTRHKRRSNAHSDQHIIKDGEKFCLIPPTLYNNGSDRLSSSPPSSSSASTSPSLSLFAYHFLQFVIVALMACLGMAWEAAGGSVTVVGKCHTHHGRCHTHRRRCRTHHCPCHTHPPPAVVARDCHHGCLSDHDSFMWQLVFLTACLICEWRCSFCSPFCDS